MLSKKCPFFISLAYLLISLFSFYKNQRHIHFISFRYFYYSFVNSCIKYLLELCTGIGRFGGMRKSIIFLLISFNLNAQIDSLSLQDSQKKIELDTKVEMSRNYFVISAAVLVGGLLLKDIDSNIEILGAGGSIAATFTTSYYLAKHLLYVRKRNRFYKHHNLVLNHKKRKLKKKKKTALKSIDKQ